jgi:hypothetical protein
MALNPYLLQSLPTRGASAAASQPENIADLLANPLSGIGYLFESFLDRPGRMARGLLAGKPRELLQVVPFADMSRLTKYSDRVSGKELLGLEGQSGFGPGALGFAAEVAFDPMTYLGGLGLFGKAGRGAQALRAVGLGDEITAAAARRLGRVVGPREALISTTMRELPLGARVKAMRSMKTRYGPVAGPSKFRELYDKPLGGMFSLEIPFGPSRPFGTGPRMQQFAKGVDILGGKIKGSAPVVAGRGLLDPRVMNIFKKVAQPLGEQTWGKTRRAKEAATLQSMRLLDTVVETYKIFDEEFRQRIHALPEMEKRALARRASKSEMGLERLTYTAFQKSMIMAAEINTATGDPAVYQALQQIVPGALGAAPLNPRLMPMMVDTINSLKRAKDGSYGALIAKGAKGAFLDDLFMNHFPRQIDAAFARMSEPRFLKRLVSFKTPYQKARLDPLRYLPREIVNRMGRDPNVYGKNAAQHIQQTYGQWLKPELVEIQGMATGSTENISKQIAKYFQDRGRGLLTHESDLFSRDTMEEMRDYLTRVNVASAHIDAAYEFLHRATKEGGGVPLARVFNNAGLDQGAALKYFSKHFGVNANALTVSQDIADAVVSALKPINNPEWLEQIGGFMDWFNGMFKRSVTVPFPAFWMRNLFGGQYFNLTASGEIRTIADLNDYRRAMTETHGWVKSGVVPKAFEREIRELNVWDPFVSGSDMELVTRAKAMAATPEKLRPGARYGSALQRARETPGLLGKVPGGAHASAAVSTMFEVGSNMTNRVEYYNRVPLYVYLRRRGFSPSEAASKVRMTQFDPRDMTRFERDVVSRLIPFRTFLFRSAPLVVKTLMDRPGGFMGQTMRGSQAFREQQNQIPPWLTQTAAIPFGGEKDGTQAYLSGLGLPYEDFLSLLRPGRTSYQTATGTLEEMAGRLSPLVKAPLELAAGKSMFSGRNLQDLRGSVSDLIYNMGLTSKPPQTPILLEQAISNSPISRFVSTARMISDPRKRKTYGLPLLANLLTAAKITDVDLERSRKQVVREAVMDLLRRNRDIGVLQKPYARQPLDQLDPTIRQLLESY